MKLPLKILIHTIYWTVYLLFSFLVSMGSDIREWASVNHMAPHYIINFLWALSIFYVFYFYFIRFFENRQFIKYLIFSLLLSIVVTVVFLPIHKLESPGMNILSSKVFIPPMAGSFIIAQCGCLVRGFENWFSNIQLRTELENRNLRNELELLKSQINPHFLFNSLNNIDSLIRSMPENASDALITLSDMLRYMIYETQSDQVSLQKEIIYMKNYIRLQQLRYRNKDYVRLSFPDDCGGIQIAPMLLIPFVENAFKHSFNSGKFPVINISVQCVDTGLLFCCRNYYRDEKSKNGRIGGVGLNNAKRRLQLLYPDKHQLTITDENNVFNVQLNIKLS